MIMVDGIVEEDCGGGKMATDGLGLYRSALNVFQCLQSLYVIYLILP